jgi:lipoprotein signal peptidase
MAAHSTFILVVGQIVVLEIELPNDQKSIAHVLTKIYEDNKIEIQPRELNFINQYKNQVAWNKSTKGKVYNFLIAAFFIILIILIFYYFR